MSEDQRRISRRAVLGTSALASACCAIGLASPADASSTTPSATSGDPRRPVLPVRADQPKDTRLTLLGTSGGPPPDYVRTGISSVLTVQGTNYVVDAGRSSVTQ